MTKDLQIGFLCAHNPLRRDSFSGTPHAMYQALQRKAGVVPRLLGPHRAPGRVNRLVERIRPADTKRWALPDDTGLDAIVALVSLDLLIRFGPAFKAPIFAISDATPRFLREFYNADVPAEKDALEADVIGMTRRMIYSSEYMADRARFEFGPDLAGRMAAIPFGLNFDDMPEAAPAKPPLSPLNLLFVGKDWERKGGARAVAMTELLNARGTPARLTIIGCEPQGLRKHPHVTLLGHLSKDRPADSARLEEAFRQAHLFVLPTHADCTPMVVAEANAFGCPVLITDTGGVGSLMKNGVNGQMMASEASAEDYADAAMALTVDPDAYGALSQSSHAHCRTRLTWDAWARDMTALIRETL